MPDKEVLVSFRPSGREVYVLPGTRLIEAAAGAGLVLDLPCGGEGLCGKCRVVVLTGAATPTENERQWFSDEELAAGWRLACQTTVHEPVEVDIPPASRAEAKHRILVHSENTHQATDDPLVYKHYLELAPPARGDDSPDLLRIERALQKGPLDVGVDLLRVLPARLRDSDYRITAVLTEGRLIDIEPGNTEADAFAVAVDVGTTTLAATLLDIGTGSEWAVAAKLNPQTRFGDDVLSRILYARQNTEGLAELQNSIAKAIDDLIGELCAEAGIPRHRVYEIAFAGNTTMQQLLCGVDTRWLGEVPFVPATGRALRPTAAELGLNVHPRAGAYLMPVIGGFVGGDTVAGMIATGLANLAGPALLIDIGTNGEIVLLADGQLRAASTAAGPAFEGARISCGMRGCTGAIEKVVFEDGRLRTNVIGNVAPVGLCGSGLIDAAAVLLDHGVLPAQGRLPTPDQRPADLPHDLAGRIVLHNNQAAFMLASAEESGTGQPLLLTQRDIRELQLATGAIRAGVMILLRQAGLEPTDLDRVLIGGGFGNFIRRNNAQRIGLLPREIEHRKIRYMGNTSLAGARLAALSQKARQLAEQLARRTEHVDLSTDPKFHELFAESMLFPEK